MSSAAGLARKDKRIEDVNVVNYPDRAEISVHFKGDKPAFLARVAGKRLIVEIDGSRKGKKKKKRRAKKKKKRKKKLAKKRRSAKKLSSSSKKRKSKKSKRKRKRKKKKKK